MSNLKGVLPVPLPAKQYADNKTIFLLASPCHVPPRKKPAPSAMPSLHTPGFSGKIEKNSGVVFIAVLPAAPRRPQARGRYHKNFNVLLLDMSCSGR